MKRLRLFLILWMITIILSCKTIEHVEVPVYVDKVIELDNPPRRSYLEPRRDEESLNEILVRRNIYYSDLVKQWESWGISVYETLGQDIPDSLRK
jgi:hypothetical protein